MRTNPILSGAENDDSLKGKVVQAENVAAWKKDRALKTAGNQKRMALELLGKAEVNSKTAGLVSSPTPSFQSANFAASQLLSFSPSLFQQSTSFATIQPRILPFDSSIDFSEMSTSITIDEPPAKVAKIVEELKKK